MNEFACPVMGTIFLVIIIMKKIARNDVFFVGSQKLTSAKARKVMVDFKFDALDALSQHHFLQNYHQYFTILS